VLQYALTVARMDLLHPELHRSQAGLPACGNTTDFVKPFIDETAMFGKVHLVAPETRQIGARFQERLALLHSLVGALPSQRIGKYLRQELQALHQLVRPVALGQRGIKAQDANGRCPPPKAEWSDST